MTLNDSTRSGGRILVDQLRVHGVQHLFCVPGESFLAVLDALVDASIDVTVCRQEGGAAMMAEAQGKLTGRPGICMVTRGPGSTNAAAGIHIAQQDSTPMILFVGQVARGHLGREAFQELDYGAVFGTMAKWVVEVDDAARLPELISRAFHLATSGRPGPVIVSLPEDMLTDMVAVADALPYSVTETYPGTSRMIAMQEMLENAERPIVILGGSRWSAEAVEQIAGFTLRFELPVFCSFRRQMLCSPDHRGYAGDLGLGANPRYVQRVKESDLILLVGGRFADVASQGFTVLGIPTPTQTLIHVNADVDELGRLYRPTLAINASPQAFAAAAADLRPSQPPTWVHLARQAHEDQRIWSDPSGIAIPGALQMGEVMQHLRDVLPQDTIMCNGAGNFATWVHRFWPFRRYGTQLAPTSGSMGYGVPAGVGAKRLYPLREVVVFAGDGDFMMHGQEFATAVQYELNIIVIIIDNGMLGTIRMHQEKTYPGRVSATNLRNPDFRAYAEAFGGHGERVATTADFAPALARARASAKPAILHCLVDAEAITPSATITSLRRQATSGK